MLALALLLCSSLLAQEFDTTWTDTIYPGGDGAAGEKWITIRVVDKLSGEPIPEAELLLIAESNAPVGGEPIDAWRDVADDDGFLSLRVDKGADEYQLWNWVCVRAPGYCQHMRMSAFDDEVIALLPSVAVPVRVLDWRNQPVAGALVGFCSGCGHTPDLVHGVTGAAGLVMLPGVDVLQGIADFYVVHPELELGYNSPGWHPGKQPLVMRLSPGVPHRGIVVDHEGVPVHGAAVGLSTVHRGPWALSKADGTFVVAGTDSATDLTVQHKGREVIFACMGTEGLRLQLPKPIGKGTVVVEVSEEAYDLDAARSEQLQTLREQRESAWSKVLVRTVGMPKDGSVRMLTKRKTYKLDDLISAGLPVSIPDEEFVFELRGDGRRVRVIQGNRAQALQDGLVRLRWFADTIMEGRIVDEDGDAIRAMVRIEPLHSNPDNRKALVEAMFEGAISMPVTLAGLHLLVIKERYSGATRTMPIDLPLRGDDVFVDLGTVIIRKRSQLTVLAPDGTPFKRGDVHLHRLGFRTWEFELSNDQWWGPDLHAGDSVVLAADLEPPTDLDVKQITDVSSRFRIEGEGPWTFQQHAGEMLLEVDADGASVGVTIGTTYLSLTGPTLLRGLKPGTHQVFVSGVGRQSAIVEIEVPAASSDRAHLKLALPQRQ
ncbi:MAG: hypothetical protein ACI85K_001908 [Hyphomicrobiaceae bacterium]|jgi:hypothetical protein